MTKFKEPIQQLSEIRDLMERSSRFISLSGLSGISAGVIALAGAAFAYYKPVVSQSFLIIDALIVLLLAVVSSIYFTRRRARKSGMKAWDRSSKRLLINLFLPLATGGLFCITLLYHDLFSLIPSVTLIFYGLALVNASKYTLSEVRILGLAELITGLAAGWFVDQSFYFWAAGFGLYHIIYGLAMYNRYEKTE